MLSFSWSRLLSALSICFAISSAGYAKEKEIRIAFDNALTPALLEKTENGIQIDIVREALQRQGYQLIPVFSSPSDKEILFQEKQVDGVVSAHKKIPADARFSNVFITFNNVAISLKSRQLSLSNLDDLSELKISAFTGATYYLGEQFQRIVKNNPLYSEEAQQFNQSRLLYSGKVDVIITDSAIFNYINKMLSNSMFTEPSAAIDIHPIFSPNSYRIGFHSAKLRDQFNAGLKKISQEDIDRIFARNQTAIQFTP